MFSFWRRVKGWTSPLDMEWLSGLLYVNYKEYKIINILISGRSRTTIYYLVSDIVEKIGTKKAFMVVQIFLAAFAWNEIEELKDEFTKHVMQQICLKYPVGFMG